MYTVSRQTEVKYGNVILISLDELGLHKTPFQAYNDAVRKRRIWIEEGTKKIRFLVYGQIINPNDLYHWATEEYKSLPKCYNCNKILNDNVYTHDLCGNNLFCSQFCADSNYNYEIERDEDVEEVEHL
jgi:hypothetical protein